VQLNDTQVLAAGRDVTHTVNNLYASANLLERLRSHCTIEATHESETAAYSPRCKPGTRKTILADIMLWVTSSPEPHDSISMALLWLSGPAGGGKTCIQREVVERCKEQGMLAASYFFSTRVAELDNSLKFVATIALQLCVAFPGLRPYVEEEIKLDPTLFDKSLEIQFERLIESPLNRQSDVGPPIPHKVIIIDGLDECRNPQEQIRIIYLLARALAKRSLPLRVAIASRPEYDIRSTFDEPAVAAVTHRIKLEDYGCDTDIEDYLIDSLFEIRRKHPSASNIPSDWPSRVEVKKLVDKASGQFIYASTFLKFVNNPRRDLTEMFDLALNFHLSSPGSINPFTDLDLLYTIVLETADVDLSELKMLLHGIMVSDGMLGSTSNIDDFFGFNPGTTDRMFCDLHSIIHISPYMDHPKPVQFHHKSLEDYLQASHRSGKFHQSLSTTHKQMLQRCVTNIQAWHLHSLGTQPAPRDSVERLERWNENNVELSRR
ncbi:hypothetical protein FA15DRAFT_720565, partial [Coprinopsis marcescibilis]